MSWSGSPARSIAAASRMGRAGPRPTATKTAAASYWVTLSQILNEVGDEPGSREAGAGGGSTLRTDGVDGPWGSTCSSTSPRAPGSRAGIARPLDSERAGGGRRRAPGRPGAPLSGPARARRGNDHAAGSSNAGSRMSNGRGGLQAKHGWLDTFGHLTTNIPAPWQRSALLEPALELSAGGPPVSKELGIEHSWEPWILPGLADARVAVRPMGGRPTAPSPRVGRTARRIGQALPRVVAALLAAGRGDLDAFDDAILAAERGWGRPRRRLRRASAAEARAAASRRRR